MILPRTMHDLGRLLACPTFDAARFVLDRLCRHGHEWGHTGRSLRRHRRDDGPGWCRECEKARLRSPRYKAYQRAYHDRDESRARKRDLYRQPHIQAWAKANRQRPEVKDRERAWQSAHLEQLAAGARERRKRRGVLASEREYARRYQRARYRNDPRYRARILLRTRLSYAVRRSAAERLPARCYGVDYDAIIDALGPRPAPGYEIDHIIPLAHFDLTKPEQVRVAFSPLNHRWLTAEENRRKGARLE